MKYHEALKSLKTEYYEKMEYNFPATFLVNRQYQLDEFKREYFLNMMMVVVKNHAE